MADWMKASGRVSPDRYSIAEGAKIADAIFAANGNPAILMRVGRENLALCLAKVFEAGRQFERDNPGGPQFPPLSTYVQEKDNGSE